MKLQSKYFIGISWFVLSLIISNANDAIAKYVGMSGSSMHYTQISFFRFLFGTLSLLPFMLYFGRASFKTPRPIMHIIRGIVLFLGITTWIFGLNNGVPIATATLFTFTIPMFVLVMAPIFLKEKVSHKLWAATLIGLGGALVVVEPASLTYNKTSLFMLVSAALFASLDIINKKFVVKETMLSMLFYSALVTTVLAAYPAYYHWQTPATKDLALLFVLGAGSNFILFCLLKAFALVNASAVAPYRYLELILSGIIGYLIFTEIPNMSMLIGALIIIPSTLYIAHDQTKSSN